MKQYGLGPNGGIVTALNLFATKFDQVLNLIERRSEECEHVVIDTPGQIEVFTWSASGNIITEALGKHKSQLFKHLSIRDKGLVEFERLDASN